METRSRSNHHVEYRVPGIQGLFGSRPPPPAPRQPPLLPLPFAKSPSLPSSTDKITAVKSRQHQKKPRASTSFRKDSRSSSSARSDSKTMAVVEVEGEKHDKNEDEYFIRRLLYSISPPPSSLPLPRFSLMRTKGAGATATSYTVKAIGGGGWAETGTSDDLRRLLRL